MRRTVLPPRPPHRVPEVRQGAVSPLRSRARPGGGPARRDRAPPSDDVAVPRAAAGRGPRERRDARGGHDAAAAPPGDRPAPGAASRLREGRRPESHRLVQGPGPRGRGEQGQGAGRAGGRDAVRRQRRIGRGRVLRAGRDGPVPGHARGRAPHEQGRVRGLRRAHLPDPRPDHRRRPRDPRGQRGQGLVRHVHAEGAVPRRGEEDAGLRAGGAVRVEPPRRHRLPDGRRDRDRRHVEGVRRDGAARVGRAAPPPHGHRPGRGLRAGGARLPRGPRGGRALAGRPDDRGGAARAGRDRRLPDPARGPRERRHGVHRDGRGDPRGHARAGPPGRRLRLSRGSGDVRCAPGARPRRPGRPGRARRPVQHGRRAQVRGFDPARPEPGHPPADLRAG